jgi:GlpG protein
MRHIGTIADNKQAERFVHFLASQHIEAALRADQGTEYEVWVLEEDRVAAARQHLAAFLARPDDKRFTVAKTHQLRRTPSEHSRVINVRTDIWRGWHRLTAPVSIFCIVVSVAATLLAYMPALAPLTYKLYFSEFFGRSFPEIRAGQVWRLITPIFLHAGVLHLVFNMLWLYQLGGQIEAHESSGYFAVMVLVLAIFCNTGQYVVSGPLFVGMSGVVYGLLGYIWMMTRFQMATLYVLSQQTVMFMLIWLVLCLVHIIPHVANTGLDHGMGHLASMRLENNERLPPIKVETKGRPHHP